MKTYNNDITVPKYIRFRKGQFWQKEMLDVDYDAVSFNIKDYLLGYDILYLNKEKLSYNNVDDDVNSQSGWKIPYASFMEPNIKYFTVDIPNDIGKHLRLFNIRIKMDIFPNKTRPPKLVYSRIDGTPQGFIASFSYPMR